MRLAPARWILPAVLVIAAAVGPSFAATFLTAAPDDSAFAAAFPDTQLVLKETELHLLPAGVKQAVLAHPFVVPGSLETVVDGTAWRAGEDYRVDTTRGLWLPLRALPCDEGGDSLVRLSYSYIPAPLTPRRHLHPVRGRPEVSDGDGSRGIFTGAATDGPAASTATGDLVVNGSKSVRMSSGNRRDMTIDQTLRLNISGRLTETIRVDAALSDDNLPVVPEGNTEELRDIDRMRVELTAPAWRATLGDFVARREGTAFGGYRRKLQGVTLDVGRNGNGLDGHGRGGIDVGVLAGSPRGVYRTLQIRGQESNQGPYFLGGGDAGDRLFIVAGSERVTLDGDQLTRGADRDYVIDYVRGTVTFTYRRLITSESEILVEFEEGEGAYARTVIGGEGGYALDLPVAGGCEAAFSVGLLRERDDPERLRNGELSESDRALLAAAGDDADAAVTSGLTLVAAGEGLYRLEDLGGVQIAVHDSVAGDYLVEFHHVGTGFGDYAVELLTASGERVFAYRGPGEGSYRIGRPLPLPASHSLVTFQARLGDEENPLLDAEWHASRRDENVLSGLGDGDDDGEALKLSMDTGENGIGLGALRLGTIRATALHEALGAGFRSFQVARDLFRYDRWGLGDRARRVGFLEERDVETEVAAAFASGADRRRFDLQATWGRLEHGTALSARRLGLKSGWRLGVLRGRSIWSEAESEDLNDPLDVRRVAQGHDVDLDAGLLRPSAGYAYERYMDAAADPDAAGGYRLRSWRGALASSSGSVVSWRLSFERGLADSLRAGGWRRERDSRTSRWEVGTPKVGGMRLQADGAVRAVQVPGGSDLTTRLAKLHLSGRWDRTGSDWGLLYGIDNSRTEVLDRQVVYVGERQGDYNLNGDFVGHLIGDFNVVTVGTDSLVSTTEVTADLTWRQEFAFLGRDRVWGAWQTFTRVTARSRSRTDDVGRLLRFAEGTVFDEEQTVLGEVSLKQEATLLRHLRRWDLRLRYDFDQALDRQYATHPERRLRHHAQATLAWNPTERSSLRGRSQRTDEQRSTQEATYSTNRSYEAVTWRYECEWSLRPGTGNRLALTADLVRRRDDVSGVRQREIGLRPSARLRLERRWSGIADMRWFHVTSDEPDGALRPFFFAESGVNVEASARLSWEQSELMTVSLAYFGRKLGERGWRHDVRLESTARF